MMFTFYDDKEGFDKLYSLRELSEPLFYMEDGSIHINYFYLEIILNRIEQKKKS